MSSLSLDAVAAANGATSSFPFFFFSSVFSLPFSFFLFFSLYYFLAWHWATLISIFLGRKGAVF
jgi:predicted tellurium resistance membrane protein TerC